jgi:hypothetical protein
MICMKKKSHNCNRRLQEGFQILAFALKLKLSVAGLLKMIPLSFKEITDKIIRN